MASFRSVLPALAVLLPALAFAETQATFRDYFGTEFERPVAMLEVPGHADHYLVVEQPGTVTLVRPGENENAWKKSVFLEVDVAGGRFFGDERGMLGMALHPRFGKTGNTT